MMELNGSNSNLFENNPSRGLQTVDKEHEEPAMQDDCGTLFINYAAIAWREMRRAWRGDRGHVSQRASKDPIIRSTTIEESLLSKEPFEKPVPLAEMVQFLVETWEEDGLYD